jgi:glycosyltransferase involved in cell wall biosynthesis
MLVGDGELRESLEADSRRLGVQDVVRFLGYRDDVPDLLTACDLFVFASHLEGLGSSLIDVMFARRPIVSTDAGGIPDLLGDHGLSDAAVAKLIPPKDSQALADAICMALANLAAMQPLVKRAETRALAEFTAERMVEKTLAVYREVLARRAAA